MNRHRLAFVLAVTACSAPITTTDDDARDDATSDDAGADPDAGALPDGGETFDAGASTDAGVTPDAGTPDAGAPDAGPPDAGTQAGYGPYDADGADTVSIVDIELTTDQGHTFTEHVFLPSSAGAHPVVSLSPGLLQPARAYTTHGNRLASHGIVVIARDDPGLLTYTPEVVDDIVYAVTVWLPAEDADPASPLFGRLDLERVGLAGHSRGGKATLLAAEHQLHGHVVGWFGLDPVDNVAQSENQFAITDVAAVGVPVVFLGAEVASSCTPANTTTPTLFPAAASPAVKLMGIGAGHTQLEDADGCTICDFCTPSGTADGAVVLRYTVRYLASFFGRVLLNDTAVGASFEGAGAPLDVADGLVSIETK